eukprot:CAMPEP_0176499100 /NCGR_PEP_ID=MMETSP0200_2-20121128/12723_1 /TAXON_ID=947934 /ORGANISM="Chaetoceros sp., Strain GSL56" /LENGTH=308 /DNA_ID=CAMNT_0017897449 /DNA_START=268 /DNA_END=1194 /DNA_ORIENTATION=-
MNRPHSSDATNPITDGEACLLPSNNDQPWPQLPGQSPNQNNHKESELNEEDKSTESLDEWENLSPTKPVSMENEGGKVCILNEHVAAVDETETDLHKKKKFLHRCASTPEFSNLEDEDSYVLDCSAESVDAYSLPLVDDTVLLSHRPAKPSMKKVPSFKDIIMLNANARLEEEKKKKELSDQHEEKMRDLAMRRRKSTKPKLVVNTIKRCAKSTGDLRSLVIHEDPEDDGYGGGGGGGGGGIMGNVIHEDEILGDTDATEFYSRKSKGSLSRHNHAKIRPDEAKRKEMILYKKNAQRMAQQEKASSSS